MALNDIFYSKWRIEVNNILLRNTDFEAVTDKCFDKKNKNSLKLLTDSNYILSATLRPQMSFESDDFDENIDNLNNEYSIRNR